MKFKILLTSFLLFFNIFISPIILSAQAYNSFHSPLGKFEVKIKNNEVIFKHQTKENFSKTVAWESENRKLLFADLIWSPQEDFVIFPENQSAQDAAFNRLVVNLNPDIKWSSSVIYITSLVWENAWRVYGNVVQDCELAVGMFDGKTGIFDIAAGNQSPQGFEIFFSTPKGLILQSNLDNCASSEEQLAFEPTCQFLEFNSRSLQPINCTGE